MFTNSYHVVFLTNKFTGHGVKRSEHCWELDFVVEADESVEILPHHFKQVIAKHFNINDSHTVVIRSWIKL